MDPGSMVAAARSALSGLLGVSPTARQRSEIKRDVQLLKTLRDQELDTAATSLELLINLEVDRLRDRKEKSFGRSYAWSTLFGGLTVAVLPGVGLWLLYPPHGLWQLLGFVLLAAVFAIWVLATVAAFLTAKTKSESTP